MSKFEIVRYVDLPEQVFPFDETFNLFYLVGYYCGSSFRKLLFTDVYERAKNYIVDSNWHCVLFVVKLNIQKVFE